MLHFAMYNMKFPINEYVYMDTQTRIHMITNIYNKYCMHLYKEILADSNICFNVENIC